MMQERVTHVKLIDLIPYLLDSNKLSDFYERTGLNGDADDLTICLKESLDLDAELGFFEWEETEGKMEFVKDGTLYIYFFSVEYASELIEEDLNLKNKGYSNQQIAERLLEYRIKDA